MRVLCVYKGVGARACVLKITTKYLNILLQRHIVINETCCPTNTLTGMSYIMENIHQIYRLQLLYVHCVGTM